jgi:transposase
MRTACGTVGTTKAYLQAAAPRVGCPEHRVVVAHVPWARPGAKHTWLFEDTCAWLAAHTAMSVLTVLLRIAWRTVAAIVTRVVADGRDTNDLLAGLARVGIDEIAYRKGHRYLSRWSSITRPAAWCGPPRAATKTPWGRSLTSWAPTAQGA